MRTIIISAIVIFSGTAFAKDVYVSPHTTSSGAVVQGHYRSAPDSSQYNNYSTQGNINPYTGQSGTVQPQPTYQQPQAPIYTPPATTYGNTNRGQSSVCLYGQRC